MTRAIHMLAMAAAMAATAATPPAAAQERRTIVGVWSTEEGRCRRPMSMITIRPMQLSGEDFVCDFTSVRREGDVVTWRGSCVHGDGRPEPDVVRARLAGNRLYYRFSRFSGENGPFRRCR